MKSIMKRRYQQPAIREVKLQPQVHVLVYSVNNYTDGGSEDVKDDSDW